MNNISHSFESFFSDLQFVFEDFSVNFEEFNKYLSSSTSHFIGYYFLNSLTKKHDFVPPFNPAVSSRITLFQNKLIKLELEIILPNTPPKKFISSTEYKQLIGTLSGEINIKKYNKINNGKDINFLSQRIIHENTSICIDSDEYIVVESNSKRSVYILYLSNITDIRKEPIKRVYSLDTKQFSHIVSNNLTSSRLEHMLFVMGHMRYKDCSKTVENLAFTHADYFVRWEAIRTFCKINPEKAEDFLLKVLIHEKHPHVINATNKSLFLIRKKDTNNE